MPVKQRHDFEIGRRIVEHEQQGTERAQYGKQTLKLLSDVLTAAFGKGFSLTNLKLMRQFYLIKNDQIGQVVSDQLEMTFQKTSPFTLSWSHYVFLFSIEKTSERQFYEIESSNFCAVMC